MDLIKTSRGAVNKKIGRKPFQIAVSALLPLLLFLAQPLGMDRRQAFVTGLLVLVIIWWCTGLVNKTLSSCILIIGFLLFSGAEPRTVFSFPLSSTFLLIALTYLFSRGVTKSGLAERYLEPLLRKVGDTPLKALLCGGLMLLITIYAIPQPLARLIIVADIVKGYLDKTDGEEGLKSALLFGVFVLYIFVNMLTMNADIILNTTSAAVAGLEMTDGQWLKYMAVPSLAYTAAVIALFMFLFRRELAGKRLRARETPERARQEGAGRREKGMLLLVAVTMALWLTEPLHGIPSWAVTLCSIGVMFALGVLELPDLKAIDVSMLVFLTAAMSIGGVMSANGTADLVFSTLRGLIGNGSTAQVVFAVMLITICMHMLLGSNTTTVSVVIPGVVFMCQGLLSPPVVVFIVYVASVTQWLFPFHSVGLMMGASKNYFTVRHVLILGLPLTVLVFAAVFGLYLPWWKLIGALE